jgi:hypothetical protein
MANEEDTKIRFLEVSVAIYLCQRSCHQPANLVYTV